MGSQQQWQHSTCHLGSSTIQHMGSILVHGQEVAVHDRSPRRRKNERRLHAAPFLRRFHQEKAEPNQEDLLCSDAASQEHPPQDGGHHHQGGGIGRLEGNSQQVDSRLDRQGHREGLPIHLPALRRLHQQSQGSEAPTFRFGQVVGHAR